MTDRSRRPASAGRRRTLIQAAAAGLFLVCFVLAAVGATAPLPVDLFFLADPLLAATAALAARKVLLVPLVAGAAALAATALLGRVFCGYLCPLGSLQDWTARRPHRRRRPPRPDLFRWRWIGRALLVAVAAAALVGIPAAWLFDPLALLWRALALAVYPFALDASALGIGAARSALGAFLPTTPLAFSVPHRAFAGAVLSAGLLALVLVLGRLAPRLWCRVACPLGALLSLVSFAPWLRRRVAAGRCLSCTRCAAVCPMGHLGDDPIAAPADDCLLCLRCADACPVDAVSAGLAGALPALPAVAGDRPPAPTFDRRRFLGGSAFGFGGLVVADRLPWGDREAARGTVLRPPGSRPEAELLDRCLRCGTCMQACPTNAVQPDLAPESFGGFFAPVLVLRRGGCDPECTRCGEVCPSGALVALSPAEKRRWVVGTAVVEPERCLRAGGRDCRACIEACPWQALELLPGRVRVLPERCTGCGLCEFRCPVPAAGGGAGRPRRAGFGSRPAIYVLSVDEAARRAPPEPARDDTHLPLFLRSS